MVHVWEGILSVRAGSDSFDSDFDFFEAAKVIQWSFPH